MAVRSAFIFRRLRRAAQAGQSGLVFRTRRREWNIRFRHWWLVRREIFASRGWTREPRSPGSRTLHSGIFITAVPLTAEPHGARRPSFQVWFPDTITFCRVVSAFPSEIISDLRSTATGRRRQCGARGGIISRRERSGTRRDGSGNQGLVASGQWPVAREDPDVASYVSTKAYSSSMPPVRSDSFATWCWWHHSCNSSTIFSVAHGSQ